MAGDLTIRQAQRQVSEYFKAKGEKRTRLSNHYLRVTHLVEEVGELARGGNRSGRGSMETLTGEGSGSPGRRSSEKRVWTPK